MALTDSINPDRNCSGVGSEFGLLGEVVEQIEDFLRQNLPLILPTISALRKGDGKRRNEKDLCADLGKRLIVASRDKVFSFYPEDPEDEKATRFLDYGAFPQSQITVGSRELTISDKLYVIEAKRLPTNSGTTDVEREREYVVGLWNLRSSPTKRITGGIERFKERLHGKELDRVGMIAFLQKQSSSNWETLLNQWILDLIRSPLPSHKAKWAENEALKIVSSSSKGVTEYLSVHERDGGPPIEIRHFWLALPV